jgi:hypothetical protein
MAKANSYLTSKGLSPSIDFTGYVSPYDWILTKQYQIRYEINSDSTLNYTTRKQLGFTIEDMLVSCYFDYEPCKADDFNYFYHELYGNCYSFNSGIDMFGSKKSILDVSLSGSMYGLTLELYLGNPAVDTDYSS